MTDNTETPKLLPCPLFFIIKNGYMFRPNFRGHTSSEAEAGRYTDRECDLYRDQKEISFRECTPPNTDHNPMTFVASSKDWAEDFAHENGNYTCICHKCKEQFLGHKRRITCKECYREFPEPVEPTDDDFTEADAEEMVEKWEQDMVVLGMVDAEPTDGAPETDHFVGVNNMINKDLIRELKHHAQEWSGRIVSDRLSEAAEALALSDARIAELEYEVNAWKGSMGKLANLVPLPEVIKVTGTVGDLSEWIKSKVGMVSELEAQLATARNDALEEAALACVTNLDQVKAANSIRAENGLPDCILEQNGYGYADQIRAIKSEKEG